LTQGRFSYRHSLLNVLMGRGGFSLPYEAFRLIALKEKKRGYCAMISQLIQISDRVKMGGKLGTVIVIESRPKATISNYFG